MMRAGAEALAHLRRARARPPPRSDRMATWQERQALFHLPEFSAAEAHFDAPGDQS